MDPNVTLTEIREHARLAAEGTDVRRNERELRWKLQALDEWLTRGGFKPDAWQAQDPCPAPPVNRDRQSN